MSVQQDGFLDQMEFVLQLIILALLIVLQDVLDAIKATIFKTESVFYHPKQDQLMLDARNGTGTIKSVLNAQPDGCSVQMEYAP